MFDKYSAPATKESVEKTAKALEAKQHVVKVVNDEKEAVAFLGSLLKDGVSVSTAGSQTLQEIGFVDYLKENDARINNFKGKAAKAAADGNQAEHGALLAQGLGADYFFSSVSAVTEEGNIFAADLTGTRIGGWHAAKHLVIVLGSNKIVANDEEAEKRLTDYQYKLESARVRVAFGIPSSTIVNKVAVRAANPFGPRTTVVIINKPFGY